MALFKTDEDRARDEYERGQKDGSQAGNIDAAMHGLTQGFNSEEYNEGWDNGLHNQPKDDD